jgi:hypothetical protein
MPLTSQQLRYLDAIIDKSEEELLYEIARGMLAGITNSARPDYETKSGGPGQSKAERLEARRNAVPDEPVSEYVKPLLEPHIPQAKESALSFRERVFKVVCDPDTLKPKEWAVDATTGHAKDVLVAVITALTAQHSVAMSMAMPSVVLLLKNGLKFFCSTKPA